MPGMSRGSHSDEPLGPEFLGGGGFLVATDQGLERCDKRCVLGKEGPPPCELCREPRLQPDPFFHHL
jgi:hypothetical protein